MEYVAAVLLLWIGKAIVTVTGFAIALIVAGIFIEPPPPKIERGKE